jgi:starch phosphorylase
MIFGRNPWQVLRQENVQRIKPYGTVNNNYNEYGDWVPAWEYSKDILGIPWDVPIVGYGAETVNFLHLWEARATEEFNLEGFNRGDYIQAVYDKANTERISNILCPNDSREQGKELRLVQQYFFVACSIKDIIRRYKNLNADWSNFTRTTAIQLNDTHPTIAIAELMCIFVDEKQISWDQAWHMCREIFAYTNHTYSPKHSKHRQSLYFRRYYGAIIKLFVTFIADSLKKRSINNGPMIVRKNASSASLRKAKIPLFGWHASR